ncbi:MAG: hypothetical protein QXJ28_02010 [Candidatus Pacearchaeota archaeon]
MDKTNRGQLKIQQMSVMLIVVFIFFIMVSLFFLMINVSRMNRVARDLERDRISGLIIKIASLPELRFSDNSYSLDADKAMIIKYKREYKEFLGIDGIIIRKLYPNKSNEECTYSNYPNCGVIKIFTNKNESPERGYIALCRKEVINDVPYDKCDMAIVMIDINETKYK